VGDGGDGCGVGVGAGVGVGDGEFELQFQLPGTPTVSMDCCTALYSAEQLPYRVEAASANKRRASENAVWVLEIVLNSVVLAS